MPVSARTTRIAKLAVIPAALAVSGLIVATSSYSAFSATTDNAGNSWATGTVALTDDDKGAALFEATNLKPGATGTKCITVTSKGSLPADVRLYAQDSTTTKALNQYINVTVAESATCDATNKQNIFNGTLENFGTKSTFAAGSGAWATAGTPDESRAYTISYTLDNATPDTAQGGTAGVKFVWEAQNK